MSGVRLTAAPGGGVGNHCVGGSTVRPGGSGRASSSRREGDTITRCVVAIVCIFIVCQTPALLNQIFWAIGEPPRCGQFHFYYTKLSDVLVVLNSSCNFAVYCLFGRTFRRNFVETVRQCCCCCCPTASTSTSGAATIAAARSPPTTASGLRRSLK